MLVGLCVGSFLNVVIWRVPQGMSVVRPGSQCPRCGASLHWRWNVPVLSWVALRGRARCCGAPISVRYPLVEAACGALLATVAWRCDPALVPAYGAAAAGLLALGVIDLEHRRLPDRVLFPTALLTAAGFG
ncbi:MAG: A24 family peptidase, partial [Acidimicrobiia bacterium]